MIARVCALVVFSLIVPRVAEAQREESADAALAVIDAQRALGSDLQISGGVIVGAGLAALVGGSIGTLVCDEDCLPAHVVLGVGAGVAAIGLALFIVGTFVAGDAKERRRLLLRERFVLVPLEGGAWIGARGTF